MIHAWIDNIIKPPTEKKPETVKWWPKCISCGAHACSIGYGNKAKMYYRVSAWHEWQTEMPPCSFKG